MRISCTRTVLLIGLGCAALPLSGAAGELPPFGGIVPCTTENGFGPDPARYGRCHRFLLDAIEEGDAEKLYMTAAGTLSRGRVAAIIDDTSAQQGEAVLFVTSDADTAHMVVARGRWPTETSYDCIAASGGFCRFDRAADGGTWPLYIVVHGNGSDTIAAGFWQSTGTAAH